MKKSFFVLAVVLVLATVGYRARFFYRTPVSVAPSNLVQGTFGNVSLTLELATTQAAQELGLGGRASIPNDYGMLFVFNRDGYWPFWMKDTLFPLDMFWLNDKGQVVYIKSKVLPETYPETFQSDVPARYVLETSAGFGEANHITMGTQLHLQNGLVILK